VGDLVWNVGQLHNFYDCVNAVIYNLIWVETHALWSVIRMVMSLVKLSSTNSG